MRVEIFSKIDIEMQTKKRDPQKLARLIKMRMEGMSHNYIPALTSSLLLNLNCKI